MHALEIGADDYLVKPFSIEGARRARGEAVAGARPQDEQRGRAGADRGVHIDPLSVQAYVNGESDGLTPAEFRLRSTPSLSKAAG